MSTALESKKRYCCAALLSLSTSLPLYGLGLGKMRIYSTLDQPFSAEIELIDSRGINIASMKAMLAEPESYGSLGLVQSPSASLLNFQLGKNKSGKTVIKINSEERISDPYIDLVVDLVWLEGQMFKAYTVLLDPPGYQLQSSIAQGGPTYYKKTSSAYPIALQSADPQKTAPIQSNENVWQLAQRYKSSSLTLPQVVLALVGANPESFEGGNLNGLKPGTRLNVPSVNQIQEVPAQLAEEEVKAHDMAWPKKDNIRHVISPPYIDHKAPEDRQTGTVSAVIPAIPKLAMLQTTEGTPPPLFAKDSIAPIGDFNKQAKANQSQHETIKAEISLNTNAVESLRESNELLKEQLRLIQEQNNKLQQQLDKRDKDVALIREQIQAIMKQRQGIASQASAVQIEESSSSWSSWILFLLLASGSGTAAYWYFLRRQEQTLTGLFVKPEEAVAEKTTESFETQPNLGLTSIAINEEPKEEVKEELSSITTYEMLIPEEPKTIELPKEEAKEPTQEENTTIEETPSPEFIEDEKKYEKEPPQEVILEFESSLHEFTKNEPEPAALETTKKEESHSEKDNTLEFEPNLASAKSRANKEERDEKEEVLDISPQTAEETGDPLKSKQAFDTLIDLAQTYLSMEDYESAKHALEEVEEHGTESQKAQASELLQKIKDRKD